MNALSLHPHMESLMGTAASLTERRARARQDAVRAIRMLEKRLGEVLGGTRLKGLPNLAVDSDEPLHGIRLRGKPSEPLPFDGRAVLVLCDDGHIKMAMRFEDGSLDPRPRVGVHAWDAADGDFNAEDLEHVVQRVAMALENHNAQAGKSSPRYAAVTMLAHRLTGALRP